MKLSRRERLLLAALLAGVAIYFFSQTEVGAMVARNVLDASNRLFFAAALPASARQYEAVIRQVSDETNIDPLLLAAIGQYESDWGLELSPPGPAGTADGGHGRGIMQIDDRSHAEWLSSNDWTDPYQNVKHGAEIYLQSESYFRQKGLSGQDLVSAALAGYNAGPGRVWKAISTRAPGVSVATAADSVTYRQRYGSKVLAYVASAVGRFTAAGGPTGTV